MTVGRRAPIVRFCKCLEGQAETFPLQTQVNKVIKKWSWWREERCVDVELRSDRLGELFLSKSADSQEKLLMKGSSSLQCSRVGNVPGLGRRSSMGISTLSLTDFSFIISQNHAFSLSVK